MKVVLAILLPIAFLLLLNSPQGSAEESLDSSSSQAQTAEHSDTPSSREKRGSYKMNRYNRGLSMLRLGKRDDSSATEDTDLVMSPQLQEFVLKNYYPFVYPSYPFRDDDTVDNDSVDGDVYNQQIAGVFDDIDGGVGDDEELEQLFRFRRSEADAPADPAELGVSKRQFEENNDEFTDNQQWSPYLDEIDDIGMEKRQLKMLRLGKRPMKMLRLGKRPMKMLRLGKRPMKMLRLGKRPMKMLRLGKRPMKMLRLGKRPMKMLRLGKRPMKMLRLGKRPMKMLRLGKRPMKMLRLGKRATA